MLAIQLLGWLLTTTDRRVRDRATKAIVSVGERAPAAFAQALARFRGINDPYVIERLAAAACGVVLRNDERDAAAADRRRRAGTLLGDDWPLHLLTRDFVRRVFAVARARGWHGPQRNSALRRPVACPDAAHRGDRSSSPAHPTTPTAPSGTRCHGMGDFGRYVLQSALQDVESDDAQALLHDAERAVFDRVLDLGWTPERFHEIDSRRGWRA